MRSLDDNAYMQAESLARLLTVSEQLMMEKVVSAMKLLKDVDGNSLGSPSLGAETVVAGRKVPELLLGGQPQSSRFELVDGVTSIMGGTATLFVKSGENFVRVSTNVHTADGARAVGTLLDPQGKAIAAIRTGKPFYGVVDILGQPYVTGYEPMRDVAGNIVGIWYVGLLVDPQTLRDAVKKTRLLNSGFAAVLDARQKIRFLSGHIEQKQAYAALRDSRSWASVHQKIPDWGFEVVMAYPRNEARTVSMARSAGLLVIYIGAGILLIGIVAYLLRRFVLLPLGGDPVAASELVRSISAGELDEDGRQAKDGSLMANMLKMRRNLRQMVETRHQNAERLSLAASVFEHANDAIFITDLDATIIEVNPAFLETTGYTREEVIGVSAHELLAPPHDAEPFNEVWMKLETAGEWHAETWLSGRNAMVFAAGLDLFAVRDERQKVMRYVGVFSDITHIMEQQQKLERMAYHDALTQLPNRVLFSDRLQQALAQNERMQSMLAVCYLDLDGFKPINDGLGHAAGDRLLVQLAQRVRNSLRAGDTLARLGGDEFALLLCGLQSPEEGCRTLARLLDVISAPYLIDEGNVTISASAGISLSPPDEANPDILLRHADQAMYLAKLGGKNRYHLFNPEHDRQTRAQYEALAEMKQALDRGEFRLHYQPKVNMRQGQVIGMEALLRWQHPELGLRYPGDFLPALENSDLSVEVGEWVVVEALRQIAEWQQAGLSIAVSVNITARHLMQPDFTPRLAEMLAEFPEVSPALLELEITESAALEDFVSVGAVIDDCHLLGVTFALDDFGAGYSSLTYLRRLPADILKIDQSFVRDMLGDPDDMTIVAGVISLSQEFRRRVIAEGVETVEHGIKLLAMNCELAQGYGIAKPMPAGEVLQWVAAYSPDPSWVAFEAGILIPR